MRKGDPSYYVEAQAAQFARPDARAARVRRLSKVAMKKESLNDVIRANALARHAELKDERALPIAIEWTRRGKSNAVRGVAASRARQARRSSATRQRTARTTGSSSCSTTSGCACA